MADQEGRSVSLGGTVSWHQGEDEPLAPPTPRLSGNAALPSEGKKRSTTPQEKSASAGRQVALETQQLRNKSPAYGTRNTGGRPTSGSRGGRGMGRRKARRWVNDHLLGSAMLSQMSPDELAEEMENLDISERKTTTALAQLLQIAPEAVVAFRSGKGGPQGETDATKKSNATAKLKSFNGISHKSGPLARFQGAAYKFSRLDRRLRAELQNEVSRSYVSLRYFDDPWDSLWMKGMEDLVNSFDQSGVCEVVSSVVLGTMKQKPRVDHDDGSNGTLKVIFDHAYHRLLTHGICQFHGLTTKSANTKDGKRVMYISRSKLKEGAPEDDVSLTEYLVALKEAEVAKKENQYDKWREEHDIDEEWTNVRQPSEANSEYVVV